MRPSRGADGAVNVRRLGRVAYEPTWRAMQAFTAARDETTADELWLLEHPPVYDSAKAAQSKIYMNALLNSMGYYRDSIRFDDTVKVVDGQQRAHIDFTVIPGKLIRLDSVWYDLLDSVAYSPAIDTLQKLTLAATPEQLVKKGDPFSKSLILAERDRLSDVYRNNGFMRFSNDLLIAVWDTVGREILSPTFNMIGNSKRSGRTSRGGNV